MATVGVGAHRIRRRPIVITRLSDGHRMVVVRRYYGGYAASDIAAMLEMPPATVRSHLRRGLATLKKEVEE